MSFFRGFREALGIAPVDRFTVAHLRYLLGILDRNPIVNPGNVDTMVETVRPPQAPLSHPLHPYHSPPRPCVAPHPALQAWASFFSAPQSVSARQRRPAVEREKSSAPCKGWRGQRGVARPSGTLAGGTELDSVAPWPEICSTGPVLAQGRRCKYFSSLVFTLLSWRRRAGAGNLGAGDVGGSALEPHDRILHGASHARAPPRVPSSPSPILALQPVPASPILAQL